MLNSQCSRRAGSGAQLYYYPPSLFGILLLLVVVAAAAAVVVVVVVVVPVVAAVGNACFVSVAYSTVGDHVSKYSTTPQNVLRQPT